VDDDGDGRDLVPWPGFRAPKAGVIGLAFALGKIGSRPARVAALAVPGDSGPGSGRVG
jgi:hypothetical protein